MRHTGGVIQIRVEYSNKAFWDVLGLAKPEYVVLPEVCAGEVVALQDMCTCGA